jgi:ABC-type transporter lipoprotein component MlaA
VYVLMLGEHSHQFRIAFSVDGIYRGCAFTYKPVLGTLLVTLHAETLSRFNREFFDFGSWNFIENTVVAPISNGY